MVDPWPKLSNSPFQGQHGRRKLLRTQGVFRGRMYSSQLLAGILHDLFNVKSVLGLAEKLCIKPCYTVFVWGGQQKSIILRCTSRLDVLRDEMTACGIVGPRGPRPLWEYRVSPSPSKHANQLVEKKHGQIYQTILWKTATPNSKLQTILELGSSPQSTQVVVWCFLERIQCRKAW